MTWVPALKTDITVIKVKNYQPPWGSQNNKSRASPERGAATVHQFTLSCISGSSGLFPSFFAVLGNGTALQHACVSVITQQEIPCGERDTKERGMRVGADDGKRKSSCRLWATIWPYQQVARGSTLREACTLSGIVARALESTLEWPTRACTSEHKNLIWSN